MLKDCIMTIWEKEQLPEFWLDALLKILPKSGDKSDPSNCRGIQLLEVMYKILGNIMCAGHPLRSSIILAPADCTISFVTNT